MGKPSPEESERNLALYNDYKMFVKGDHSMTIVDLVAKYRISSQRVWQIIHKMEKKENLGLL